MNSGDPHVSGRLALPAVMARCPSLAYIIIPFPHLSSPARILPHKPVALIPRAIPPPACAFLSSFHLYNSSYYRLPFRFIRTNPIIHRASALPLPLARDFPSLILPPVSAAIRFSDTST